MERVKCNQKACLNYEKIGRTGMCGHFIPPILDKIIPNTIKCPFFDNDFWKTYEEWKRKGGMFCKKKSMTVEEAKEIKKARRKPRSDIGKTRNKKD